MQEIDYAAIIRKQAIEEYAPQIVEITFREVYRKHDKEHKARCLALHKVLQELGSEWHILDLLSDYIVNKPFDPWDIEQLQEFWLNLRRELITIDDTRGCAKGIYERRSFIAERNKKQPLHK